MSVSPTIPWLYSHKIVTSYHLWQNKFAFAWCAPKQYFQKFPQVVDFLMWTLSANPAKPLLGRYIPVIEASLLHPHSWLISRYLQSMHDYIIHPIPYNPHYLEKAGCSWIRLFWGWFSLPSSTWGHDQIHPDNDIYIYIANYSHNYNEVIPSSSYTTHISWWISPIFRGQPPTVCCQGSAMWRVCFHRCSPCLDRCYTARSGPGASALGRGHIFQHCHMLWPSSQQKKTSDIWSSWYMW